MIRLFFGSPDECISGTIAWKWIKIAFSPIRSIQIIFISVHYFSSSKCMPILILVGKVVLLLCIKFALIMLFHVWTINKTPRNFLRTMVKSCNPGGNSTLIRRVCATGVLNLSPCSGVEKPKKYTPFWSYRCFLKSIVLYCIVLYCIVLYCIVFYCIVLKTKIMIMFMLYFFNQIILPFHFTSFMFVQKSFKFSITFIRLS